MTRPRQICVVTGSRADYGLLYWLMRDIDADPLLSLRVVVTGSHLSARFGMTVDHIERDGFSIAARVPLPLDDDSRPGMSRATALALAGCTEALAALSPDLVVVLGDRFEILGAAQAALLLGIPLAHIHGGEVTEGMLDDSIRHALTKMAALHFVSAAPYRRRVIQMGESPDRVFLTGAPGLDHIRRTPLLERPELEAELGFRLSGGPVLLVTYHPPTLCEDAGALTGELVSALGALPAACIVITGVNADPNNRPIRERLDAFAAAHPDSVLLSQSLGQRNYLSLMRLADAVVGNSSSGIIEAPAFGVPTINIGPRQAGRLRAVSVIDCAEDAAAIAEALARGLSPAFRAALPPDASVHGHGGAAQQIVAVLRACDTEALRTKRFHDLQEMPP
ncbi:MAG: UDP-N-acetylglucosamine 2-epimerase [Rhodospirillaceae bacterium]